MPVLDGTALYWQDTCSSFFLLAELTITPTVVSPCSQGTKLTTFGARWASIQLKSTERSRLFIASKARRTHYKIKRKIFFLFLFFLCHQPVILYPLRVQSVMLHSGHYTGFQGAAYIIYIPCLNLAYALFCKLQREDGECQNQYFFFFFHQ